MHSILRQEVQKEQYSPHHLSLDFFQFESEAFS